MVSESVDVEGSEGLEEEPTNLDEQEEDLEEQGEYLHEQGEDLKKDGDVMEDTTGEALLLEENEFREGRARSSSAFVIGANLKFPVRSHYLSASIGSCHDLCKSGYTHQEPEKKIRRPFLGTTRESRPLARARSDSLVRASSGSVQGEKDPQTTLKKTYSERDFNHFKLKRTQSEIIKLSSVVSPLLGNGNESQTGKKMVARSSSFVGNMIPKVKEIKSKSRKETISREKEKPEEKAKEPMNTLSPPIPLKKSSGVEARLYKNLKNISPSNNQSVSDEASRFEPSSYKKSLKKASKVTPPTPSTLRWTQVRVNKDSKDNQTERQNALSSTPSIEEKPSQVKEETQQKLKPINPKVVCKIKSEDGSRTNSPRRISSVDSRMIPKRRGSLPEERDYSAWKLKFKRETVVALQCSNSSPKKLKFKRGKVLDDDESDKDGIACELNHNNDTGNEPNGVKPEPNKVQLRHQEGSSKKDNVVINNVIEETATKLVKTRKSKVKALVGAFESVMSVSDQKSVMEAGAS